MRNRKPSTIILFGVLLFSGCGMWTGPPSAIITFDGRMDVTEEGFYMSGQIENQGQGTQPEFENVTVSLYHKNKTRFYSEDTGDLLRSSNISIHTDRVPHYVIIHSPQFWQKNENTAVDYYIFINSAKSNYTVRDVSSRDELPVPLPN